MVKLRVLGGVDESKRKFSQKFRIKKRQKLKITGKNGGKLGK